MGDGTKDNPYTREDVLRLIKENGGKAAGLDLSGKIFKDGINLRGINLRGIILKKAVLWDVELEVAFFEGSRQVWVEGAHLEDASLSSADLEEARIFESHLEGADLHDANLKGALLTGAHLERANLSIANLEGAKLRDAHLEGAFLMGVGLSSDTLLVDVDWGNYILGEEREGDKKKDKVWLGMAEETCRCLKIWYTEHGMYDVAAKFYYREMEARRKALKWRSKDWHHRLYTECMRALFGYGEGWKRILFWIAGFILFFALIYFAIGTLTPNTFLGSLYYSASSFIALGYGSWVKEATGWVKGLGVFETFLGFFLMTLLLVTFVRKWTR
jgi:hypothetical protein